MLSIAKPGRALLRAAVGVVVSLALTLGWGPQAFAASDRISLIRDAEIEATIRSYAAPLLGAAGIDVNAVKVHLVNDDRVNAFVAGGMNLFINTGLLQLSETPNVVIGVIAHEIGHIEGGHLIRRQEALENATAETILATVLGAMVIAAGGGGAGAAVIQGGQEAAMRGMLRYSQGQESSADHAGLRYLNATHQSARGLLTLLHKLASQEQLTSARQSPYLRTHPLSRERLLSVEHEVSISPYSDVVDPPERMEAQARMAAKLIGFINQPSKVLRIYPETDKSLPARYARAIAYHRSADLTRALREIDGLIAERPNDAYFYELKGQILFEQGHLAESVGPYQRSVELAPNEPLLRLGLGRALIEAGDAASLASAVEHLRAATQAEPTYPVPWHFLGVALGRKGDLAGSSLAFAERSLLNAQYSEAAFHAEKAEAGLKTGSPQWLRAQDILNAARNQREANKQ
jgi:predicted Zn-dependent protease